LKQTFKQRIDQWISQTFAQYGNTRIDRHSIKHSSNRQWGCKSADRMIC